MRALFTAVGSIGSRHIGNLVTVCHELNMDIEIDVLRYTERELPTEISKNIRKEIYDDSYESNYDFVFVTDETKTHYNNIKKFINTAGSMFIEKPIFEEPLYSLQELGLLDKGKVFYVAAPIRFTEYYKTLQRCVLDNNIYSARIIFSSYMPNWQKERDYRKSFRCFYERGGGVDIDSLHEIDYMTSLFGFPQTVQRMAGKYSNLEMDANDIATYIFGYKDKIVEMHLDYFGRTNNRKVELFAKDDVIEVDFNKKTMTQELENKVEYFGPDDTFYLNEMRYFINLALNKDKSENINPPENAYRSLALAKGIIL